MFKKIIPFIIFLGCLIVSPTVDAATDSYQTIEAVSLKEKARAQSKTIQVIKANVNVTRLGQTGQWTRIQIGRVTGFVPTQALIARVIPIPDAPSRDAMTYKGSDIVSINGTSYQIDAALKPFFKQNAAALKSTLVLPKTKGRTLIGFEQLQIGFFTPVLKPFQVDRIAATRIDSLHISSQNMTISTAATLRQVVVEQPLDVPGQLSLTLNGPIHQLYSSGKLALKGKGTIARWDVAADTTYSFISPITYVGTVSFLNLKSVDGVLRASKTLRIQTVSAPTSDSIIDGNNGYVGGATVTHLLQGKRMDDEARAIASTLQRINTTTVKLLFDQLRLPYHPERIESYTIALRDNEKTETNRRLIQTKSDLRWLIDTVNRIIETDVNSPVFVSTSSYALDVTTRHQRKSEEDWSNNYSRNVTATLHNGQLQHITFKREETPVTSLAHRSGEHFFATAVAPGTYRTVHLDGNVLTSFQYEVVESTNQRALLIETINGKAMTAYKKTPPAYEAKLVKLGNRTYLAIRSKDSNWLKHVHRYDLPVNANYIAGGHAISKQLAVGDWDPKQTVILSYTAGRLSGGLKVHAYGYDVAPY